MPIRGSLVETTGKKVIVFGLARSGVGAANLLSRLGSAVTVTDVKAETDLAEYTNQLSPEVKSCLGGYPEVLNGTDLVVVSPGVPLTVEPLVKAREQGIKIIGEFELAYQLITSKFTDRGSGSSPKFLAVTGTNGKSTTTALLNHMLTKAGRKTIFGGNIGKALTGEILKIVGSQQPTVYSPGPTKDKYSALEGQGTADYKLSGTDYVVAEVSSFQLESIDKFRPMGAAILNITPDHMDRYHLPSDYIDAKCRIFENQGQDNFLVLNADDPVTAEIAKRIGMQGGKGREMPLIYYFSRKHKVKGAFLKEGAISFNLPDVSGSFAIQPSSFKIKGVHNLENAMASAAMALLAGCPPSAVEGALLDFPGLEHRMEFVRELDGVKYINDSKGTNVGAVMKSLEGFSEPIVLIAGGRDKAGDFNPLRPLIKEKVKALVLIGEAAAKMRDALGDVTNTLLASDLNEAVIIARKGAVTGDIVLLSPGCASFDMFTDFEDRGRRFKAIVEGLI
jgi:UDP-N-acetylmuramoylalanine--D-glutamate ligase